jgi:hypothetical protein
VDVDEKTDERKKGTKSKMFNEADKKTKKKNKEIEFFIRNYNIFLSFLSPLIYLSIFPCCCSKLA